MKASHYILGAAVLTVGLLLLTPPRRNTEPAKDAPASPAAASTNAARHRVRLNRSLATAGEAPAATALQGTNLYARLAREDPEKLRPEQLEGYLATNHRSAGSLLAAFGATGDRALLREAMEKFPNDPHVALTAYYLAGPYDSQQPASEDRRRWLETLRQSDPGNALGSYLAAADLFKSGQTEEALKALTEAADRPRLNQFILENLQNGEEAYTAAGYSEAEAKGRAAMEVPLPQYVDLKLAGTKLAELAASYRQTGDEASAQAALQMGLALGERLSSGRSESLIQELVGLAVQKRVLSEANPGAPVDVEGRTAQARLDQLLQHREELKALARQSEVVLQTLSDQDIGHFFDRTRSFGEEAAMRWAVNRGQQP